ncbi:MAG: pyridoxal-phosphate dependent enzyme, partial [Anaerolineae bacterium]|nr:pyridoxal-phosphate dependent enzyme [Anaerolineae bacterium]
RVLKDRPMTMWRYRELLPVRRDEFIISMGEGGSALLHAHNLGMMLGAPNIYIKDERQNPTNSFKDRQAALVTSMMKEAGITELIVASTGNVAISYSAYSAHAGIKLWTFIPSLVPPEKMREIAIYGSEVIKVTDTYDATKKVAAEFSRHKGIHADRGIRNVGTRESMKTIAFEVAEQLALEQGVPRPGIPWRSPDWYVQSVSGGMGPIGFWKGYQELFQMGLVDRLPKLAVVQAEGCAPMVNAFLKNSPVAEPVEHPNTRVITIATGNPGPAYEVLYRVITEHGGTFTAVSDEQTFRALHILAKIEGLSTEPAAAAAFAGLIKLLDSGTIQKDETVVVNCSGHTFPVEKFLLDEDWLKVIETAEAMTTLTAPSPPSSEDLLGALDQLDKRVKRIAIVEDNPDAARLLRRILQTQGDFQIIEAHSGAEGLKLIRTMHPDLILLDLMMPDMDGFEMLNILEADTTLGQLPVIVITAKELSQSDRNRLKGKIQMLLQKGTFMDENLVEEINALLGQSNQPHGA